MNDGFEYSTHLHLLYSAVKLHFNQWKAISTRKGKFLKNFGNTNCVPFYSLPSYQISHLWKCSQLRIAGPICAPNLAQNCFEVPFLLRIHPGLSANPQKRIRITNLILCRKVIRITNIDQTSLDSNLDSNQ